MKKIIRRLEKFLNHLKKHPLKYISLLVIFSILWLYWTNKNIQFEAIEKGQSPMRVYFHMGLPDRTENFNKETRYFWVDRQLKVETQSRFPFIDVHRGTRYFKVSFIDNKVSKINSSAFVYDR